MLRGAVLIFLESEYKFEHWHWVIESKSVGQDYPTIEIWINGPAFQCLDYSEKGIQMLELWRLSLSPHPGEFNL